MLRIRNSEFMGLEEAPAVLMLHGFAQSARSWDRVAFALSERLSCPVHCYEFEGHGDAPRPDDSRGYGMDAVCDRLLERMRAFDCPPIVVGYSMGGRIALAALHRWASLHGESFPLSALVLESADLGPADEESRLGLAQRNAEWADRLRIEGVNSFMRYWENLPLFATQRNLPEAVRSNVREGRLANDAEVLALTFEGTGAHAMPFKLETMGLLKSLRRADVPVLYLAGGEDAKYSSIARELADSELAEVLIVSEAGHNVHLESPDRFVDSLVQFVSSPNRPSFERL